MFGASFVPSNKGPALKRNNGVSFGCSGHCSSKRSFFSRPKVQDSHLPLSMFSEDEIQLRNTVSRFATQKIKPLVKQMDRDSKMDPGLLQGMFEQGFMGLEIPTKYGGTELQLTSSVIVIEELAKVDPAVSVICDVQNTLINNTFLKYGNEDQKKEFLPKLSSKVLGSFCLSEWGSGSDAFALKTKAEKIGDHWVLNGTKAWITNSAEAGIFIVMANTDFSLGYKGITAFIVDRSNPGLEVGKKEDKLGIRASSTCEVRFTNCKVSKDSVLGEVGKGYKIAIEGLNEGRIGIAAQMIGLAQGAFNSTMPYIHQRKQFNQSIASFQGMQFQIAECATDIEAGKLLTYNASRLQEAKKPFVKEASMAKLFAAKVAEKVSSQCINMLGGVGFTKEFEAEKFFRDCKIGHIYEGTTNIQLRAIAQLISKDYQ